MPYPLGIEIRPEKGPLAKRLFAQDLITHVQVSAPALWRPKDLENLPKDLPLILHSTFLNTMGKNDWKLLRKAAKIIRALKPIAVVEHFGSFISATGTKTAVHYPKNKKNAAQAVKNLTRWQDLLGINLYIENLPITDSPENYLRSFQKTLTEADLHAAIDLPHLILSFQKMGKTKNDLRKFLKSLSPQQIHVSGIRLNKKELDDNHLAIDLDLPRFIEELGMKPKYVTVEQSQDLSENYLEKRITAIQKGVQVKTRSFFQKDLISPSELEMSHRLAVERAKGFGLGTAQRQGLKSVLSGSLLQTFESQYPFMYPLSSLARSGGQMHLDDLLTRASQVIFSGMGFESWYGMHNQTGVVFAIKTQEQKLFFDFASTEVLTKPPKGFRKLLKIKSKEGESLEIFTSSPQRRRNAYEKIHSHSKAPKTNQIGQRSPRQRTRGLSPLSQVVGGTR